MLDLVIERHKGVEDNENLTFGAEPLWLSEIGKMGKH